MALAGRQGVFPYPVNANGRMPEENEDHTSFFGRFAEAFIRRGAGSPWFCYLNWTDPHIPWTPPSAHRHVHDGERYVSPGTEEQDLSDKSDYWRDASKSGPAHHQEAYEGVLEELIGTDAWFKRLMTVLGETGQAENTILIYSSDNGYMLGEHGGMKTKGQPYEESARVPFLVRGPGIPSRAEVDAAFSGAPPLVSRLDLTATILKAAEADDSGIDGRDLRSLTSGAWRKRLLFEDPLRHWAVIREGHKVLMRFDEYDQHELYDLAADPYQLENLAASSPDEVADLSAKLAVLRGSTGDALRGAETAP